MTEVFESEPELAEQILVAIRDELHSRSNVGWHHVDDETYDEIQDVLRGVIENVLQRNGISR
jgi:hypothetical protein